MCSEATKEQCVLSMPSYNSKFIATYTFSKMRCGRKVKKKHLLRKKDVDENKVPKAKRKRRKAEYTGTATQPSSSSAKGKY